MRAHTDHQPDPAGAGVGWSCSSSVSAHSRSRRPRARRSSPRAPRRSETGTSTQRTRSATHPPRPSCPASARRRRFPCFTWGWCRAPSTTPSTRSTAGISRISPGFRRPRRRPRRPPPPPPPRYKVLVGLQQAGAPMLPPAVRVWLDPAYADSLAAIPDDVHKQDGIAAGSAAAAAMLAARADDGRFDPFAVVEGTDPGEWRKTPPNFGGDPGALVGNVRPVPRPERGDAPHRRPERAHQRRLRGGLQRGQGARLAGRARAAPPTRRQPRSSGRTAASRSGTASSARWRRASSWTASRAPACSR